MTTYKGETLEPRQASLDEEGVIDKLDEIRGKMKELSEDYSTLIKELPVGVPLVLQDETGEYRTRLVDKPTGHFVNYYDLVFAMDAKTTKADLKALDL